MPVMHRTRLFLTILFAVLFTAIGFVANPWIVMPPTVYDRMGDGLLIFAGLLGMVYYLSILAVKLRRDRSELSTFGPGIENERIGRGTWRVPVLFLFISVLWLALHWNRVREPRLFADDLEYIAAARTLRSTLQNLFTPYNEHLCVATRLFTWAICSITPADKLERGIALAGLLLFASTWLPLYCFARREFNSPTIGLTAVCIFSLSTAHREVVEWYSASQWCWALFALLACLLLLQRDGPVPSLRGMIGSAVLAAAAPLNFSVGLFVGPIATAYSLARQLHSRSHRPSRSFAPIIGTLLFLAVVLPWKGKAIVDRASYDGQSPATRTQPLHATLLGVRSTVDMLMLENLGVHTRDVRPRLHYVAGFFILIIALGELAIRTDRPVPLALATALVLIPYATALPFRAWIEYRNLLDSTRYQLFPQMGMALVVCTAAATIWPKWASNRTLPWNHALLLVALATGQFVIHAVL